MSKRLHKKKAKEMNAFANSKGGIIIFGVDENRAIVGVESEKSEPADDPAVAEQPLDLAGRGRGGDVEVLRPPVEQQVPHAAADEIRGMVEAAEPPQDLHGVLVELVDVDRAVDRVRMKPPLRDQTPPPGLLRCALTSRGLRIASSRSTFRRAITAT